jgi:hypothetical protein
MFTVELSDLELMEGGYENDPTMRVKVNFPLSAATGTKNTAVAYFEIEPGHRLGTHTDSAEEILLFPGERPRFPWATSRVKSRPERWRWCQPWCPTRCATWATKRFGLWGSSPVRR